ncbi:MAG TPA: ATP-binding protein [Geobacteraceae bacterium]|nr:ATP-binding protein [Geobacteraceae bacterium]
MTSKWLFSIKPEFRSAEIVRRGVKAALNDWLGIAGDSRIDDFCQVISELVNNAVEHGRCTFLAGELRTEDDKALFSLITDGIAFDPTAGKAEMPDFDENYNLPEGGYGLAIINQLSDECDYRYHDGKNEMIVSKLFPKRVKEDRHGDKS